MATTALSEAALEGAVLAMYTEVATQPEKAFHFWSGRDAAARYGYRADWLSDVPAPAVDSFAGVGNPHREVAIAPGSTVVDLGSGAGLDAFIAARRTGRGGAVVGIDLNETMLAKARALAAQGGLAMIEFRKGRIEAVPVDDGTADLVLSNGVINLSFRKRQVMAEAFRVLRPGGRVSLTDVVSDAIIPASIADDPKLWAS